jgi:hypothetical protein
VDQHSPRAVENEDSLLEERTEMGTDAHEDSVETGEEPSFAEPGDERALPASIVEASATTTECLTARRPSHPVVLGRPDISNIGASCVLGLLGLRTANHDRTHGHLH